MPFTKPGKPFEVLRVESGGNCDHMAHARTAVQERRYWNVHRRDPADLHNAYRFLPTIDTEYVPTTTRWRKSFLRTAR